MKKLLLSLFLLSFISAFSAFSAELTITASDMNNQTSYSNDDVTISFDANGGNAVNTGSPFRVYKKNKITVEAEGITEIKFTASGSNYCGNLVASPSDAATVSISGTTVTVKTPSATNKLELINSDEDGQNIQLRWTEMTVTYVGSTKNPADLSFGEKTEFTVNVGEEFTGPTLDNPHHLPVSYASSNEIVATVDDKGIVTLNNEVGSTTISAEFVGNNEYKNQKIEYTITVIDPNAITYTINQDSFTGWKNTNYVTLTNNESPYADFQITAQLNNALIGWNTGNSSNKNKMGLVLNCKDGYVLKSVLFNGNTKAIDIYKKDTAYSEMSEFSDVDDATWGTSAEGSEIMVNNKENYVFDTPVKYVGFRPSTTGANTVESIVFTFALAPAAPAAPIIKIDGEDVADDTVPVKGNEISFGAVEAGVAIYYNMTPDNIEKAPAKAGEETQNPDTIVKDGVTYTLYNGTPIEVGDGSWKLSYFARANGVDSEVKTLSVSKTTGIEGIAAEDGAAEWFNLQGVRVSEPQQGIYVRVANGKAAKVVVE